MIIIDNSNIFFDEITSNSISLINSNMIFRTIGNDKMTITSNGDINVHIGSIVATSFTGRYVSGSNYTERLDLNSSNYTLRLDSNLSNYVNTRQVRIINQANQIIIGNGDGVTKTDVNLSFVTNTLNAPFFSGNGASLTTLNAGNIATGTLIVGRGGTGQTTFTSGQLLIGNGTSAITQSANLTWTPNTFSVNGAISCGSINANSHYHDDRYSLTTHNHDGTYSFSGHNHDYRYAWWDHYHDDRYARLVHNHDTAYSLLGHNHDTVYSKLGHGHDYSPSNHNHEGTYLKYQSIDGRLGVSFANSWYNWVFLAFGAGHWHTANYAYMRTIQVSGDVGTFVLHTQSGNAWIYMYYNGGMAMGSNWVLNSDSRTKFDIQEIKDNECLSIIRNINMYKYKLKEARHQKRYGSNTNYGFIAQDVLKHLPQAVSSTRKSIPSIHKPCTIIEDILELDNIDDYVDKYNNVIKYDYKAKIDDILELLIFEDFAGEVKLNLKIIEVITNKRFRIKKVDGEIDYEKKYFVFGNIIEDLLSLEHAMVHNVGIGAIKCIDNDVTNLKNENEILKEEIKLLKEKLNILSNHVGFGNLF